MWSINYYAVTCTFVLTKKSVLQKCVKLFFTWRKECIYYGTISTCTKKSTPYSVKDMDYCPSTSSISTRPVSPIPREKLNNSSKRNYGCSLDVQLYLQGNIETIKNTLTMV